MRQLTRKVLAVGFAVAAGLVLSSGTSAFGQYPPGTTIPTTTTRPAVTTTTTRPGATTTTVRPTATTVAPTATTAAPQPMLVAQPPAARPAVAAQAVARTGADIVRWTLMGAALMGMGAVLVTVARRRRSAHTGSPGA